MHSYAAAVKKTMFFLVLVEGTTFAPYLVCGLLASRWLLWHCTPIVFLSCEIQTTLPRDLHSGHILWSPTLTIGWINRPASCWMLERFWLFSFWADAPLLIYKVFTPLPLIFFFEKNQWLNRVNPENKRSSSLTWRSPTLINQTKCLSTPFSKFFPIQFAFHVGKLRLQDHIIAGKVYFVAWHYDVKLQADNHVRWDVAERLNRKQIIHWGGKL